MGGSATPVESTAAPIRIVVSDPEELSDTRDGHQDSSESDADGDPADLVPDSLAVLPTLELLRTSGEGV
mgnify:CR=1 FL=1